MVTTYQVDILGILNLQNHIKRHHIINIRTVLKYNSCETIVHWKHKFCLKSKKQSYGLQTVLPSINIVSQKQIVDVPEPFNWTA